MPRTTSIGCQDFETIRRKNYFYVDKTRFIQEWWEQGDCVTLITRPRRFGKTLAMSMLEKFFSLEYAGMDELFQGLKIWEGETYHGLQGTYPVISLSFASIKEISYGMARRKICQLIGEIYDRYAFLLEADCLTSSEKDTFRRKNIDMDDVDATLALHQLSLYLSKYYGRKVLIFLDEYDTPMQEAYGNGYWDEMVAFTRSLFNATFKTNPYLERAVMTGITRVSKESIFSDLNNLEVVTTVSEKYRDSFGFTEREVTEALAEYGLQDQQDEVKRWYDGFVFGSQRDIYNPWSILNYLDKKKVAAYWANSSSNGLIRKLVREGGPEIKMTMEQLLRGGIFRATFDEQVVFNQLDQGDEAVWSLLLASGYLKAEHVEYNEETGEMEYDLCLTNREVRVMFSQMVQNWFQGCRQMYHGFIRALLADDVEAMNLYMNKVALQTFSYFDTGKNPSGEEPERFYHGFVLGMLVELADRYTLTSNRESGFGRYDVVLEPKTGATGEDQTADCAILMEFKVQNTEKESDLCCTVAEALGQIERRNYAAGLVARGIPESRIRKYGFAFCGKRVLIGKGKS